MIAPPADSPDAGRPRRRGRRAFTLLEVLSAMAIFLLAMAVFASIFIRNGEIAVTIQRQNLATHLCQSKMHEIAAGVVSMSSQGDTPFDEEPDYTWSMDAENGPADGLWSVTVTVRRQAADGDNSVRCTLTQMMLDPSVVGSNEDVVPVTSSTSTGANSGTSGTSGASSASGTSGTSGAAGGASGTPAASSPATGASGGTGGR